ncbi:pimeloyl-ACP methyl ester carboxylesterase [Pacificibacter maritimus]|uniref:Pimeloyl-ACP methyl ester carboxylesterase n=1 Tax=Pacificibacter maritimus TaxID=762213 RepID=A0A3N4VEM0_9RHOB|nr:alpha/beta hydrolase [Pacificibacter maritimus]RPE71374.1 pimeloyl-ACP methyl ester carboxylesterase [Pacificibacter maritimus]
MKQKTLVLSIFIGLILLVVVTGVIATKRIRQAEKLAPMRGQMVTGKGGATVHVETYGPARAQPLILIHGMSGSTYDMTYSLLPEIEDEFRVYVVDRPGFGHSPMLEHGEDLLSQARAIREAVFALDARKPIVLGQSYGGAVALRMALDAPESLSALVLVSSPSHEWEGPVAPLYRVMTTPVVGPALAWLICAFVPKSYIASQIDDVFAPQSAPDGYIDAFQPLMSLRPETAQLNARQRVAIKPQIVEMALRYPTIGIPVESLHGTADTTVPNLIHAIPLDNRMQVNRLTELGGIGHMPHHVAVDEVEQAIHRAAARASLD